MRDHILTILKDIGEDRSFENSGNFIEDGLLDSFEIVELVEKLENGFNIEISGKDIIPENFMNMEAMEALVLKYKEKV